MFERPDLGTALLLGLLPLLLLSMTRDPLKRAALLLGGAVSVAALIYFGSAELIIYFPPVLINLALLLFFARTLQTGKTPLITRFAGLFEDHLDEPLEHYTRQVTWLWVCCFALLTLESVLLALFAPQSVWSLFANILNYVFVLLVFALEYVVRIRRFAYVRRPGFFNFLRSLARTDFRRLM